MASDEGVVAGVEVVVSEGDDVHGDVVPDDGESVAEGGGDGAVGVLDFGHFVPAELEEGGVGGEAGGVAVLCPGVADPLEAVALGGVEDVFLHAPVEGALSHEPESVEELVAAVEEALWGEGIGGGSEGEVGEGDGLWGVEELQADEASAEAHALLEFLVSGLKAVFLAEHSVLDLVASDFVEGLGQGFGVVESEADGGVAADAEPEMSDGLLSEVDDE